MERCPSCNAQVNSNSKFCNECGFNLIQKPEYPTPAGIAKQSYRLRSPILESDILYDDSPGKSYGLLTLLSYAFWLFALAFIIYGITIIYKNYTVDFFKSIMDASVLFALSFFFLILPGVINILVNIEEHLAFLAKEAKKDKMD